MTIAASAVIDAVTDDIQDAGNTRVSRATMLAWLNDGRREIVMLRPDASTSVVDLTLAAGCDQSIPSSSTRIIANRGNVTGERCQLVKRAWLDERKPGWRKDTASALIKAWVYDDEQDPKHFEVWPPALNTAQLKFVVSVSLADCANDAAAIGLDDEFKGPLVSYILHRYYRRDAEDSANVAMASTFYELFMQQLGLEKQANDSESPKVRK